MSKGKFAIGALLGAAAGFVAGILTAPKSGKETREDLKDTAVKVKDDVTLKASQAKDKAADVASDVIDKASKVSAKVADNVATAAKDFKSHSHDAAASAKKNIDKL